MGALPRGPSPLRGERTSGRMAQERSILCHIPPAISSMRPAGRFAAEIVPVTVGSVLAIPQGTFVEGSIIKIGKRGSTRFDGLHIQFKQIVFTNGYNAALDGSVVEAKAMEPSTNSNGVNGTPGLLSNGLQQGPAPPQPPPLPQVGPPKGPIIGATLGGMAALVITGILLGRHHMHEQPHDFDTGFQFEVVLQTPLTLDGASVAAAVSASSVPCWRC